MNLRLFSIALLISALPTLGTAETAITLNKGDFVAAEKKTGTGEIVLSLKLSKSGKAKIKKMNEQMVGQAVSAELGGVSSNLKFREPIQGDSIEMGPYTVDLAQKIIAEVNAK